jgi:hypothetical protein
MKYARVFLIILVLFLSACGFIVESSILGGSGDGDQGFGNWAYRQEITLTNSGSSLSDYSVRLTIDSSNSDFWSGVESDGRSVFFTAADGTSTLPFYIDYFNFGSQDTIIYVRLSTIASGNTSVYLYFGDTSRVSSSDADSVFLYHDDFEDGDTSDWTDVSSGGTVQADTDGANGVLLKTSNSDPNGGYVSFPSAVSDFEIIWRTNRINNDGGAANRYAIEDGLENGYGPSITPFDGATTALIEERNGGAATTISSSVSPAGGLSSDTWYIVLLRRYGTTLELELYDDSWLAIDSVSVIDGTITSFTRFAVRGGFEFWTDDIRIRGYASNDPSATFGTVENL